MIYYKLYDETRGISVGSYSSDKIPEINNKPIGTEITKELFDKLMDGCRNGQIIYKDNDGELHLRDKFTKWDESTREWILDDEAIAKNKYNIFIAQAKQALIDTAEYESESYKAVCTEEENKANLEYRIELRKIVKGMYNGTELPINPNKKE